MYICEKCHDTDRNAIGCSKTYRGHHRLLGDLHGFCEICDMYRIVTVCNRYEYEKIQERPLKCPTCVMKFTCTRLLQHGPDSEKVLLCSIYKKEAVSGPQNRIRPEYSMLNSTHHTFNG